MTKQIIHFSEAKGKIIDIINNFAFEGDCYIVRDIWGKFSLYFSKAIKINQIVKMINDMSIKDWIGEIEILSNSPIVEDAIKYEKNNLNKISDNVYFLEAPLTNRYWIMRKKSKNTSDTKVVTFYSYKGGVGRTTALLMTAMSLSREGKKVFLIDADIEAPGIYSLMKPNYKIEYGLVDFFVDINAINSENIDINNYLYLIDDRRIIGNSGGEIYIIPANIMSNNDYSLLSAKEYLEKITRIDIDISKFEEDITPIDILLDKIKSRFNPDYILIDSRSGLHQMAGILLNRYSDLAILCFYGSEQNNIGMSLVLPQLINNEVPFLLVNTPTPVNPDICSIETDNYIKAAYKIIASCKPDYKDSFDEDSMEGDHYPINISYSENAVYLSTIDDLVNLYNKNSSEYKQISEIIRANFSSDSIAVNSALKNVDSKEILYSMSNKLSHGSVSAAEDEFKSEEDLKRWFYPLKEYKYIFDDTKFLVLGTKGSGKTALFSVLKHENYAISLAKYLSISSYTINKYKWIVGLEQTGDYPTSSIFNNIGNIERKKIKGFWILLLLKCIEPNDELIRDQSYRNIIQKLIENDNLYIEAEEHIFEYDKQYYNDGKLVTVIYDALDKLIDKKNRKPIISELIGLWYEYTLRLKAIKSKVFLRSDIYRDVDLTDKVKLKTYSANIEWDYEHLFALVWKRLGETSDSFRRAYTSIANAFREPLEHEGVGFIPLPYKEINKEVLELLIGSNMGAGNKAYTHNWFKSRLADTKGQIVPRSMLDIFKSAAEKEIETRAQTPRDTFTKVIRPKSLETVLDKVSKDRVDDLKNEYPEYENVFTKIKSGIDRSPVNSDALKKALIKCGIDNSKVDSTIDDLIEIGIMKTYQRRKSDELRYHFPDIYLYGLGLKRYGQN